MGIELFGIESGLFVGLACFIAYFISANRYLPFPNCKGPKHLLYQKLKRGKLDNFDLKTTLIYKYFQLYIKM
jgi:hypothetical protein